MASLYGRMQGNRGVVTRTGGKRGMWARLETWEGSIQVNLRQDGSYEVRTGSKSEPRDVVAKGKIQS